MLTLSHAPGAVQPIRIGDRYYDVEPIDPGFAGVAAVRLSKRHSDGPSYDVVLCEDGRVTCDCAHFTYRLEGTSARCKHGAACVALGLLAIAPADAPKADALAYLNDSPEHRVDGYRPGWDAERFEPTPDESAELAEFDPEYHAWLDRLAAERLESAFAEYDAYADCHEDEVIRAVGVIESRRA